jgi:hypothetical protein
LLRGRGLRPNPAFEGTRRGRASTPQQSVGAPHNLAVGAQSANVHDSTSSNVSQSTHASASAPRRHARRFANRRQSSSHRLCLRTSMFAATLSPSSSVPSSVTAASSTATTVSSRGIAHHGMLHDVAEPSYRRSPAHSYRPIETSLFARFAPWHRLEPQPSVRGDAPGKGFDIAASRRRAPQRKRWASIAYRRQVPNSILFIRWTVG